MNKQKDVFLVRTVLFDLDGTLADTAPDLAFALNTVLTNHGRKTISYDVIRPIVSHGANALIYLGFELNPGEPGYNEIRQELLDVYRDNIANKTQLFPGMDDVLKEIENRGMKWGVVTNKPSWLTKPLLKALGLHERATCIVSGDTTSKSKPHPEPMYFASQIAETHTRECLYIGDAARDIEAGRRAGMKTLAALFGYICEHEKPDEWGADGLINTPLDILSWIDNQNNTVQAVLNE